MYLPLVVTVVCEMIWTSWKKCCLLL